MLMLVREMLQITSQLHVHKAIMLQSHVGHLRESLAYRQHGTK